MDEQLLSNVSDNPLDYGSKGESWSEEFVKYMRHIVSHPAYAGMPDAVKDDGKIQWEAPSNRSGGKYQYTHQKRREWWQNKAKEIGVDINTDKWISKTAKRIHPTGEKPCKRCGQTLRIGYVYPKQNLINKIHNFYHVEISPIDTITEVIQKIIDIYGSDCCVVLRKILSTTGIKVPDFKTDSDAFLLWIEDVYIPNEPSILSPGVMSNAPDRFDGFHSFNRCCRGVADKGRSTENLRSYTTDRRVFEFWSDGDWVAADRLMGLVRTFLRNEQNADGGKGEPTADHIGPLSLGFCHRPEFRLLSKEANSAKNNRMTLLDVKDLINSENGDCRIISWHSKHLWNLRKYDVDDEEKALRLSKMLRDNQRNAMVMLSYLFDRKAFSFLAYMLNLGYADYKVSFSNLRTEFYVTKYDSITKELRDTIYTAEQKARRLRIGFEALRSYIEKDNRHLFIVNKEILTTHIDKVISLFEHNAEAVKSLDEKIESVLMPSTGAVSEMDLRNLTTLIPQERIDVFEEAKLFLESYMQYVGEVISEQWESDRYVRTPFNLD